MTNEEAIKRLKEVQAEFNENWVDFGGINEAFKKAYQALEERPRGEWKLDSLGAYCSECGTHPDYSSNYCPNCGAKMESSVNNGMDNRT